MFPHLSQADVLAALTPEPLVKFARLGCGTVAARADPRFFLAQLGERLSHAPELLLQLIDPFTLRCRRDFLHLPAPEDFEIDLELGDEIDTQQRVDRSGQRALRLSGIRKSLDPLAIEQIEMREAGGDEPLDLFRPEIGQRIAALPVHEDVQMLADPVAGDRP
jgi:hypothetical protein